MLYEIKRNRLPKDDFFDEMGRTALTYSDVRLQTMYSEILPKDANLETRLTKNISIPVPLISAAMDTVTESRLAIAIAKLGGIGIIHKNMSAEEQAKEVARVKLNTNGKTGLLESPICVRETDTIETIYIMKEHSRMKGHSGFDFDNFPVIDRYGKLVGIVTGYDLSFYEDSPRTKIKDIMTRNVKTINQEINPIHAYNKLRKAKKKNLIKIDDRGRIVGLYTFKDLRKINRGDTSSYNMDEKGRLRVGAAIGVGPEHIRRLEKLLEKDVDVVVIDTAHGDTKGVVDMVKRIERDYPTTDVVAGNVAQYHSAKRLADAGADAIKVGIGPGSICTTRPVAGVGCPQVTAVYRCSLIGDEYGIPIIADGGLEYSGDIPVAIGAGANSVMMGSMFAGTEEAPGEVIFVDGRSWKNYRGMGSIGAMEKNKGSRERYGQSSQKDATKLVPEGVEGRVPFKGALSLTIDQYIGGLRAGMGYVGAKTIEELRLKADFDGITGNGLRESHPHGITITREAPNYHR